MPVVCASSDYEQLAALCDRVLIFGAGRDRARADGRRGDEGTRSPSSATTASPRRADESGESTRHGRPPTPSRRRRRRARAVDGAGPQRGFDPATSPSASPCRSGAIVVRSSALQAGHVPRRARTSPTIFGSQAVLLVLALGLIVAAHRRRLRPLDRRDAHAVGDDDRRPERQPRLADRARRSSWRCCSGARRRAHQRRARGALRHRLVHRHARHRRRCSRARAVDLDARRRSPASPTCSSTWTIGDRFLGISLDFYYGLVATLLLWYVFEFTPLGPAAAVRRPRANVVAAQRHHVSRIRWGALIVCGV